MTGVSKYILDLCVNQEQYNRIIQAFTDWKQHDDDNIHSFVTKIVIDECERLNELSEFFNNKKNGADI